MDSKFLYEFQRQTSIFFRDKIKVARMALTDVTPVQLLTEEITSDEAVSSVPDMRSMRIISHAAFEVDDYTRIVDILHKKLKTYERRNWRTAYKALILLEHLLTHGPVRIAEEFQSDKDIIRKMAAFQHVDEKGFNWGLSVKTKSERVLKLIEDGTFLKEERERTRKLTSGIKGFGSFSKLTIPEDDNDDTGNRLTSKKTIRCNSEFIHRKTPEILDGSGSFSSEEPTTPNNPDVIMNTQEKKEKKKILEDHPFFCKEEHQALISLLS